MFFFLALYITDCFKTASNDRIKDAVKFEYCHEEALKDNSVIMQFSFDSVQVHNPVNYNKIKPCSTFVGSEISFLTLTYVILWT